jgi:hypothetical protein
MRLFAITLLACMCCMALVASTVQAKPSASVEFTLPSFEPEVIGDVEGTMSPTHKVLQDTVWIADWSFDGATCDESGWIKQDLHILNDGQINWNVSDVFDQTGGIFGSAAVLGYSGDVCCIETSGYSNEWYQAIRITYSGAGSLSFDYLLDSESDFDFMQIEMDSGCASFDLLDYDLDPSSSGTLSGIINGVHPGQQFRLSGHSESGLNTNGSVNIALPDFGTTDTHCVYISFVSDIFTSPCDGGLSSTLGAALVVDNIEVTGVAAPVSEDFEGALDPNVSFVNLKSDVPFGEWARTYAHITDNSICTENVTCAWLWTDYTTPTIANDPSMAFGPQSLVILNWLDDVIVSPWVSLATTPNAQGTILSYRMFSGQVTVESWIAQNFDVRGKSMVDGTECITSTVFSDGSGWGHWFDWYFLQSFNWFTNVEDLTPFFSPTSSEIQVRLRVSDWQHVVGVPPPTPFIPGPGPFIDRVRLGRQVLTGPVLREGIDSRTQAQDAFPTEIDPAVTPAGDHYRPTIDRFGSTAFSMARDLGINNISANLITGDSIAIEVFDARDAGGIIGIDWYGAIVAGPHVGKAPPPWTVGSHGFFVVPADSVRTSDGAVLENNWFVDLDDEYFRGGDVLHYLWLAQDAAGGVSSDPGGLSALPTSVADAELATQGLLEVSFLPRVNWDPGYLARIAADDHGKLEPTPTELANSTQTNCILYAQLYADRRLSGDLNRTSFTYTLDRLGYRGHYDVYDHQGVGNTNNHLGGRATVQQVQGYSIIVWDAGLDRHSSVLPDGIDLDAEKIDQAGWFREWLSQASMAESGRATLWMIGANAVETKPTNALFGQYMGVHLASIDQGLNVNPDVLGQATFTFTQGGQATCTADFTSQEFSLDGGCPNMRDYDALGSLGTAVATHSYRDPVVGTLGDAAIVMNSNTEESWNTIMQSHAWFDIRDLFGGNPTAPTVEDQLVSAIFNCVLPLDCQHSPNPTGVPGDDVVTAPARTALHQNVPNPFNPVTTIRFDLARTGHVSLRIYDVAGRAVRTLVNDTMKAAADHEVVWDGRDDAGTQVSSGVYFYRLEAGTVSDVRKMVLMR